MAFTYRNKRAAYDNISVGNATGHENVVANGADEGETTVVGQRLVTSDVGTLTSVLTQAERLVAGVSDYTSRFLERL